jgi:hypothetical protein
MLNKKNHKNFQNIKVSTGGIQEQVTQAQTVSFFKVQ